MKPAEYFEWLKENWARTGPVLAFYLTLFLLVFVRNSDFPVFLILLQTPLYMLHETEEYLFPGGFGRFFNRKILKTDSDDKPVDKNFIFIINIGLIWIILPLFGLLSLINLNLGLWIPYFTFFAGAAHIALAIKGRTIYNPGLIVSLVLNIPAGIAVVLYFFRSGILENLIFNPHFFIGLGINLLLPVTGAFVLRKYRKEKSQN